MLKTSQDFTFGLSFGWVLRVFHYLLQKFCKLLWFGFNLGLAVLFLLLVVALLPLVWLGNCYTSPGRIFFKQERVGRDGRIFRVVKFRTMTEQAEIGGIRFATENDCRITWLGRFLRKTHLDELPQGWNVLRGEMCIIGPRPERPPIVEAYSRQISNYSQRHAVRPGITGWAQVHQLYGQTLEEAEKKLRYDLEYIQNQSLWLDLLIILKTISLIIGGKGR